MVLRLLIDCSDTIHTAAQAFPKAAVREGPLTEAEIATRLYVEQDLGDEVTLGLDHARAHFLRSVLRLSQGANLALFNGRDGEWRARLDGLGKGWASVTVEEQLRPQQADADLWLVFAPIKRARIDFLAEKATELGVAVLQPMFTQHTAVSRVNVERLAANAREAAEQCERLSVPEVRAPAALYDLLADWPAERHLLLCAERSEVPPIGEGLRDYAGREAAGPWAVMIGPEGGFARSELDALMELDFVTPVGLGPRVLRADTAALAALACWQALLGRWPTKAEALIFIVPQSWFLPLPQNSVVDPFHVRTAPVQRRADYRQIAAHCLYRSRLSPKVGVAHRDRAREIRFHRG